MQSKNMIKHVFLTSPPTKHVVQTTGHDTDAVRKIQSGMHLFFFFRNIFFGLIRYW